MNLYILRHAIAVERGTKGFKDDSKRPLTREGSEKMRQNALGMSALKLSFDLILTSPFVRAKQTAAIVAKTFENAPAQILLSDNLIPGAAFEDLCTQINKHARKGSNILLVGHEPHLSELISFLLIGETSLPLTLKKGGLAHLTIRGRAETDSANLQWLLTPSQLGSIA